MQYFLWDVVLFSDVHLIGSVATNIIGIPLVLENFDKVHTMHKHKEDISSF